MPQPRKLVQNLCVGYPDRVLLAGKQIQQPDADKVINSTGGNGTTLFLCNIEGLIKLRHPVPAQQIQKFAA
jgi:hypothetical protein